MFRRPAAGRISLSCPTACAVGYRSFAAPRLVEYFLFGFRRERSLTVGLVPRSYHQRIISASRVARLFLFGNRQRHAADGSFADAAKVECTLVLYHVGDLCEALR